MHPFHWPWQMYWKKLLQVGLARAQSPYCVVSSVLTEREPKVWLTFTLIHVQRLASEDFVCHNNASWTEVRAVHTIFSTHLRQQLWWLQTVSPGIITPTDKQTVSEWKDIWILFYLMPDIPHSAEYKASTCTYRLYSVGSPQVALCRL